MPIIHYPGYITKAQAAIQLNIKERTITDWISRNLTASRGMSYIRVDGFIFIRDKNSTPVPPAGVSLANLEQVRKFGEKHNIYFERLYEEILRGSITAVLLGDRVFVINNDPALVTFLMNHKLKRRTV